LLENYPQQKYRRSTSTPLLKYLSLKESTYVLRKIYKGICSLHTGSRDLAAQTIRAGFYWPTILYDATNLVKKYDQC
jgi:hypothetical protein